MAGSRLCLLTTSPSDILTIYDNTLTSPLNIMEKPTVLFIHGIWHTPAHWRPIRDLFESNDYETACPALPTSGATESIGLDEDVARITKELDRLVMEEQKEVVIVAHSFGGVASSEATRNEYSRTYREKEGTKGGVKHLVFLCSHLFPEGTPLDQPWPEYMQLNVSFLSPFSVPIVGSSDLPQVDISRLQVVSSAFSSCLPPCPSFANFLYTMDHSPIADASPGSR